MTNNDQDLQGRKFLKDIVRLETDFSQTDQSRGILAPPAEKPPEKDCARIQLPDGIKALKNCCTDALSDCILLRQSVRNFSDARLSLEQCI